jgi:hypothetical protein
MGERPRTASSSPNVEKSSRVRLWETLKLRQIAADQNNNYAGIQYLL